MKKFKKALSLACAAVFAVSMTAGMTACNTSIGAQEGELTIHYYEGGYGTEWLETACQMYKEKHPDFKYKLIGDTTITNTVFIYLKSGQNLSDIYMTQGSSAWPEWVTLGYLENLESVYESEVETSQGKQKIKDYMDSDLVKKNYIQRFYGQGSYYPWLMPWSSIGISFAYDEDILLSTKHTVAVEGSAFTVGDNWTAPPRTVNELAAYCTDILARGDGIKPLSLPFADGMHWLNYFMSVWWAQYQGVYEENTLNVKEGDGAYYDFYNFENADVWKQVGIQSALDQWRTLIIGEDGNWKNTVPNIQEHSVQEAERIFARGEAALMLAGSFSYNEMKDYIVHTDHTFKMMSMPLFGDGTKAQKNEDGTTTEINYFVQEDSMFVPAKAVNKELAKDFLAFLCNEEVLLMFTEKTGTMRPFKYNPFELMPEKEWGPYTKSYLDLFFDSDVRLSAYPANKQIGEVSPIYLYRQPSMFGNKNIANIVTDMKTKTGAEIMTGGTDNVYTNALKDYNKWLEELGLSE